MNYYNIENKKYFKNNNKIDLPIYYINLDDLQKEDEETI